MQNNNEEWKEDIQTNPTEAEQIVIVDKMIGLITGGKTTGMEPAEVFTMGKALELYRGYLTGKEGVKVPIKIKKKSIKQKQHARKISYSKRKNFGKFRCR